MPLYPAVQVLPLHIIQSIALYVSGTGDKNSFKWYARGIDSDRNKLLPLMATCHLWRSVISPLYYYTAAYGEGSSLYSSHKHQYRKLFIDEVAALGNHQHIRKLYFTVQVANLVDPGTAVKDLQELVDKYGSLKGVFDVELEFRNYRLPTYWHPETADENSVSGLVKLQNVLSEYIKLFNQLLPNKRMVSVKKSNDYYFDTFSKIVDKEVCKSIPLFMGNNLAHISLSHVQIGKDILSHFSTTRLRKITIAHHKGSRLHIALVRQNSMWLESLDIESAACYAVVQMTLQEKGKGTLVYPRLKKLTIQGCTGRRSIGHQQPECNPFPVLEQFICSGHFPFATPIVIKQNRSSLRVLKMDFDLEIMALLNAYDVFANGSFKMLESVQFGSSMRNHSSTGDQANQMLLKALNLSKTIKHVHVRNAWITNFQDTVYPSIVFSNTLRYLNLEGSRITVENAIMLLGGFKKLISARLALRDGAGRTIRMPSISEIEVMQDQFKDYESSVRRIHVQSTSYPNTRRSAEYIVLMASIVKSAKKFTIDASSVSRPASVIERIKFALKRPIYKKCEHVNSVEFCID